MVCSCFNPNNSIVQNLCNAISYTVWDYVSLIHRNSKVVERVLNKCWKILVQGVSFKTEPKVNRVQPYKNKIIIGPPLTPVR